MLRSLELERNLAWHRLYLEPNATNVWNVPVLERSQDRESPEDFGDLLFDSLRVLVLAQLGPIQLEAAETDSGLFGCGDCRFLPWKEGQAHPQRYEKES